MDERLRHTEAVLGAALRVREAAQCAVDGTGSAGSVLAALSEAIPHDHASLAWWDPHRRRHVMLATNYPDAMTPHIETRLHEDALFAPTRRPGGGMWLGDVPQELRPLSSTIRDFIDPGGFEDGVTDCLFAQDGRYVGVLLMSMARQLLPSPIGRRVLALLDDCLAAAVDSLPPEGVTDTQDRPAPDTCVVVFPASSWAAPIPVSGDVPAEFADARGPLAAAVRNAAASRALPTTILMAYGGRLLELRLSRRGVDTVVACRPVHHPGRLSLRELQVLAEVTVGATNREIAENLHVSVRTVAAHIEHILTKLDVPNRAAAAGRAATWGLEPARPASPMNGMGARRLCVPQPDPCRIPRDHRVGAGTLRSVDDRPPTIASAGSGGYFRFHRRRLIPGVPHGRRVRPQGVDQLPTPGTGAGHGAASLGDIEVECAVGQ